MCDAKLALIFLVFRDLNKGISKREFKLTLNKFMSENQFMEESELKKLEEIFLQTIQTVETIFGDTAFLYWNVKNRTTT